MSLSRRLGYGSQGHDPKLKRAEVRVESRGSLMTGADLELRGRVEAIESQLESLGRLIGAMNEDLDRLLGVKGELEKVDGKPWVAAGVSKATWYRQRKGGGS